MIRTFFAVGTMAVLAALGTAAEKTLQMKDLPPAVQKTVQENLNGAQVKAISQEKEDGVLQYEIETMLNAKHRDFNVDTKGTLVVVEEETSIDSIPAAAKAAILKKVGSGKLAMVEIVIKGKATLYEASYTIDAGRRHEVLVKPDGTETKD